MSKPNCDAASASRRPLVDTRSNITFRYSGMHNFSLTLAPSVYITELTNIDNATSIIHIKSVKIRILKIEM